jgi:N-acetylornithine carbamoyltransferase
MNGGKRDFLSVESWGADEIEALLALAARVKKGGVHGGLEKKVLAMVFMDPSLRTRASFEAGLFLHGGHALVIEPGKGSWSLETDLDAVMDGDSVEHIIEAARVLGRYAAALALRAFPRGSDWASARLDKIHHDFAKYCEKPVINLESARRHPCQELADALTLKEKLGEPRGRKFVLAWANHPKALPTAVPVSAALAAARLGMEVVIARPPGYDLDPDDSALIGALATENGGSLRYDDELDGAMENAEAVYVKSWGALSHFGDPQGEAKLRAPYQGWRCTTERLKKTKDGKAIVMHCLPVRRGVEIDGAVLDGPHSVVVDQAENRLHVQRALMLELMGDSSKK